jgi:hypothetical protein
LSTPRIPDNVLKKVMKKTSVAATNTLDATPMPNQTISIGATAIRGMLLRASRNGSQILAT